jgi:RimJ/RimL family protein N-acetyltransferase
VITIAPVLDPDACERRALESVIHHSAAYYRLVEGCEPCPAEELAELLQPHPDPQRRRHIYAIRRDGKMIGLADVLQGWKTPAQSMIGLMLIHERHQGQGAGGQAYRLLEAVIAGWPGMRSVRIGVNIENHKALRFWTAQGFVPTGERTRLPHCISEIDLLEKTLSSCLPPIRS